MSRRLYAGTQMMRMILNTVHSLNRSGHYKATVPSSKDKYRRDIPEESTHVDVPMFCDPFVWTCALREPLSPRQTTFSNDSGWYVLSGRSSITVLLGSEHAKSLMLGLGERAGASHPTTSPGL